jgi:hypothetical protein
MPILGILASGISGNLWQPSNSYDSIATITPYTTTTTVNFTSIPQTYRHLQVRLLAVNGNNSGRLTFNNDSTNGNYASHELYGNGSSAFGDAYVGTLTGILMPGYGGMGSGSFPTASVIDILDYTNTNKAKTVRGLSGIDQNNTNGVIEFGSGLWNSTAAITSLKITIAGAGTIGANSHFALYGIK